MAMRRPPLVASNSPPGGEGVGPFGSRSEKPAFAVNRLVRWGDDDADQGDQ